MGEKQKMIESKGLSFSYAQAEEGVQTLVLNDLNITIEAGSFVGILGANGSGKSTFSKLLNGLLLPMGGKVFVLGMDTQAEEHLLSIRQSVGLVFQNPDNQIVSSLVEDDVAFAPENLGVCPKEIRARVDHALAAVGLADFARHAPHLLSGGQKQRLAIAGILAMQPKCIVLDEPTAMLDPIGRKEVLKTVLDLCRTHGITVILITHHMNECVEADRLLVMDAGQVVQDGTPKQIFAQVEYLESLGLSVPDSTKLLHLLRSQGHHLPLGAFGAKECAQMIFDAIEGVCHAGNSSN